MKTQQVKLNQPQNIKTLLGRVTNPFANAKKVKKYDDIPDANLYFLKQMHIQF